MIERAIERAFASHMLNRQDFPIQVRFLDKADREKVLLELVIRTPGPVRIPPLSEDGARVVLVETTYPNGHQYIVGPGVDEFHLVPPPRVSARVRDDNGNTSPRT